MPSTVVNPEDRRSSPLVLTPAGRRLLERTARTVEDELSARFAPLGEPEIRRLAAAFTKLDTR